MMYQLRDLRVRYLPASSRGDATWSLETREPKKWTEAHCYYPTLELELQAMAERAVRRIPDTYDLPNEIGAVTDALVALFNDFEVIAEEVDA